jgi:hypothetical protein
MFPFLPEIMWKPLHDLGRYIVVEFDGYSKFVIFTNRNRAGLTKSIQLNRVMLYTMTSHGRRKVLC